MILSGNNLGVEFDLKHNQEIELTGGTKIEIIREWNDTLVDAQTDGTKLNGNTNRLEVAPQVGVVTIPNPKFPYQVGDRLFCHYMAYDCRESMEIDGKDVVLIDGDFVLFLINQNNEFIPADNHYLGERIYEKELQTTGGIFLNVMNRPQACKIKITHVPRKTSRNHEWIKTGMTVLTVDDRQYPAVVDGKEYIKLIGDEIVAEFNEN